ncbi:MAG: hypothetical protein ABI587_13240 [Gemmatimonadales bacterium]
MWPDRPHRGERRGRLLALLVSLGAHALLFLVVITGWLPTVPPLTRSMIVVPRLPQQERTVVIPLFRPKVEQGAGALPRSRPPENPLPIDTVTPREPEPEIVLRPDSVVPNRGPAGRMTPGAGDGRLWVRPLPVPPQELARRLSKTHVELVDSAVTAIVQGYLDSIAREPGADQVQLPDWTTTVEGRKFGLDSRNIYIAGLKIPAIVLALLPLPQAGNQQRALDHTGQWIADDLRRAAERANTLDEFKRAVQDLRQQKKEARALERAQREQPDSSQSHR